MAYRYTRFVLMGILLPALLLSCGKERVPSPVPSPSVIDLTDGEADAVEVSLSLPGGLVDEKDWVPTRSTSTLPSELNTIRYVTYVFFHNKDGVTINDGNRSYYENVYKWVTVTTKNATTIKIVPGKYDIYAVCNDRLRTSGDHDAPYQLTPSATRELLEGGTSTCPTVTMKFMLNTSRGPGMLFSGKLDAQTINSSTGSITIPVTRGFSQVELRAIQADFTGTAYAGQDLKIDAIYLTNVWRSVYVCGPSGPRTVAPSTSDSGWYNRFGRSSTGMTSLDDLISEDYSATIADGSTNSTYHYFYCTPNTATSTAAGSTSSHRRCTRLVIQGRIGSSSTVYYWHCDVPGMDVGLIYRFTKVIIKNAGGVDPEHNNHSSLTFVAEMASWEETSKEVNL